MEEKGGRGGSAAAAERREALLEQYGCRDDDLMFSDHFSRDQAGVVAPLRDALLDAGDHYMHLADLRSYLEADRRLIDLYATPDRWARMAVLNVAAAGGFSSDRTIAEYAREIWDARPCPVT